LATVVLLKRNSFLLINFTSSSFFSSLFASYQIFFTEAGKVVIVLSGRHAGKKAVVVKTFDDGNSERRFSHCLIAGLARNPRKVTKAMPKEKVEKRTKQMKPFVKYVNVRHIFPTRYVVDLDLKKAVDEADLVDAERKVDVKKNLKKIFYERYLNQKEVTSEKKAQGSSYFFQKLRF
jgi:large subunit ribosomal protein L27e